MSVDTACSSSLVATSLARQTLTQPTTAAAATSALVGGINMMLLPSTAAMFQRAGMLAPDGRCKALDAAADGYVRAEAAAMMLLGLDDGTGGSAVAVLAGVWRLVVFSWWFDHPFSSPSERISVHFSVRFTGGVLW